MMYMIPLWDRMTKFLLHHKYMLSHILPFPYSYEYIRFLHGLRLHSKQIVVLHIRNTPFGEKGFTLYV